MSHYRNFRRITEAELAETADKVMRGLIEALKPHNIVLRFPSLIDGESAVLPEVYGDNHLPGHAFPCRPGEDLAPCASVTVQLRADGTDENHGKPFHMEVTRSYDWRRNRNEGKFRFKGTAHTEVTPAMVEAVVEALKDAEEQKAREKADHAARLGIRDAMLAHGLLNPKTAPYDAVYKDFILNIHEGHFIARWSNHRITPHQMTCILAAVGSAVKATPQMLDNFDAHGMALKVAGYNEAISLFKTVAGMVEGFNFEKEVK